MQLLSKAIHEILTTDTDILETVGSGNIWHSKIPQRNTSGTDAPPELSIYYYTFAVTPNDTKSGASQVDDHMVRVCIVGNDDETMYDVARYVRYALDRVTPGTYGGIPIDGIRFLNAGFDPEGSFELENQSWVLEFKVRVIDPDIRIPGGTIPTFAGFAGHYSTDEQVWPYSKWLGGATIYWRTWDLSGATLNANNTLTGLSVASVNKVVKIEAAKYTSDNRWSMTTSVILNTGGTDYQIFIESGTSNNRITVWYTKL